MSCAGLLLCLFIAPSAAASSAPLPVVVYVHGYRTELLDAVADYQLAEQFAKSGVPAAFIVAAAPSSPKEAVVWPDLDALLARAEALAGRPLSRTAITLAGHSGAYRTLRGWVDHAGVERLILLDALYGDLAPFRRFLRRDGVHMSIVSRSTLPAAERLLSRLDALSRSRVDHHPVRESHMEIVTSGRIIPEMLRSSSRTASFENDAVSDNRAHAGGDHF